MVLDADAGTVRASSESIAQAAAVAINGILAARSVGCRALDFASEQGRANGPHPEISPTCCAGLKRALLSLYAGHMVDAQIWTGTPAVSVA